jgi:hypothetical protein
MLRTLEEIKQAELSTTGVINGVDNPNILSVDSTEPVKTDVDELTGEEEIVEDEDKKVKPAIKEEKLSVVPKPVSEKPTGEKSIDEKKTEDDKDPVEKRIGKLTKKWRATERERDFERTKRLAVEVELKKLKASIPDTERPKKEDFEDDEAFLEALTDWKVESKLKAQQAESTKKTDEVDEKQAAEEVEQELVEVADRGRDKYDDYDVLVFHKDLVINQGMVEAILESDIAEDIFYYLGKNPDEAAEIGEMSVIKAAKEIGKIEVKLVAEMPKPSVASGGGDENPDNIVQPVPPVKKKTTKTPEPITPVKATGAIEKDPLKMSPKEYRAWREAGNS